MAEPMSTNIHPAILPAELADALFAQARIATVGGRADAVSRR